MYTREDVVQCLEMLQVLDIFSKLKGITPFEEIVGSRSDTFEWKLVSVLLDSCCRHDVQALVIVILIVIVIVIWRVNVMVHLSRSFLLMSSHFSITNPPPTPGCRSVVVKVAASYPACQSAKSQQ